MPLPAGTRLGPYELVAPIGAGGMGEVYRATDPRLGRDVAIKLLPAALASDPERCVRFEREARLLAALNHPGIAHVYGFENATLADGSAAHFLALELVEGEDLRQRLARGAIAVDEALEIARQIAQALEAAHEKGIVHRDLKPANVMVTPDGTVKVLDFGLAKAYAADGESLSGSDLSQSPTLSRTGTRAGAIIGTAAYMAPEQARGKAVDRRADIWALGVLLWELLTGRPLFQGETASDTLAAVLRQEPAWEDLPASLPAGAHRVLRHCLVRDPRERLHDVADVRIELGEAAREEAPPLAVAGRSREARRRWPLLAAAAALAAVAALAGATIARRLPRSATPTGDAFARRFEIPLPEGVGIVGGLSLSPDGRTLAFSARDAAGRTGVWVRDLDRLVPRRLEGTDEGRFPFWSPDSRRIGFFARGGVQVMDLIGQASHTLVPTTSVTDARGGAWGAEFIVYAPSYTGGLLKVPVAGGTPQPATRLDPGGGGTHRWPCFLPDGRHFVFYASAATGTEPGELRLGDTGSTDYRILADANSRAVFLPPGYLLYANGRVLVAHRLDLDRLELRGNPVPVGVELPLNLGLSGHRSLSAAAGVAAYQVEPDGDTTLAWMSRRGSPLGTVLAGQGLLYDPRVAPDGERVAVSVYQGGVPTGKIWILDPTRNNRVKMTFDDRRDDQAAVWSPDGTRLAVTSIEGPTAAVYVLEAGRPRSERLFRRLPTLIAVNAWLPSGRGFLVTTLDADNRSDISRLPPEPDAALVPLVATPANEHSPALSPDGQWLAYVSDAGGRDDVYVRRADGQGDAWRISSEGGQAPSWRRDGRELFYVDASGRLQTVPTVLGSSFSAGTPEALFDAGVDRYNGGRQYDVAPDGRRILLNRGAAAAKTPIVVVLGWGRELARAPDR